MTVYGTDIAKVRRADPQMLYIASSLPCVAGAGRGSRLPAGTSGTHRATRAQYQVQVLTLPLTCTLIGATYRFELDLPPSAPVPCPEGPGRTICASRRTAGGRSFAQEGCVSFRIGTLGELYSTSRAGSMFWRPATRLTARTHTDAGRPRTPRVKICFRECEQQLGSKL